MLRESILMFLPANRSAILHLLRRPATTILYQCPLQTRCSCNPTFQHSSLRTPRNADKAIYSPELDATACSDVLIIFSPLYPSVSHLSKVSGMSFANVRLLSQYSKCYKPGRWLPLKFFEY